MPASKPKSPSEIFTASDVARFCGVDLKTIHTWCDKEKLRCFRSPGRHLRFRRHDLIDFLLEYGYPIPEVLRMEKPRVVVVDEDPNVLAALRRALSRRFDLFVFQEPADAIVAVGSVQPDAVVLEAKTQSLDGLRLLERLGNIEATAHIRTVVYSADEDMRKPALAAGASDFVLKGEVSELRESLERLLGLEGG
jgi:PleD family two-component response regulator